MTTLPDALEFCGCPHSEALTAEVTRLTQERDEARGALRWALGRVAALTPPCPACDEDLSGMDCTCTPSAEETAARRALAPQPEAPAVAKPRCSCGHVAEEHRAGRCANYLHCLCQGWTPREAPAVVAEPVRPDFDTDARPASRIRPLLARLAVAWERWPDWRLGQVIANAAGHLERDEFYVEDEAMLAAIELMTANLVKHAAPTPDGQGAP